MRYNSKADRTYVTGMQRGHDNPECVVSHLYDGTFCDPGLPLCARGWTRMPFEYGYSIWRNNISKKGLCRVCVRRADAGLDGVTHPVGEKRDKTQQPPLC